MDNPTPSRGVLEARQGGEEKRCGCDKETAATSYNSMLMEMQSHVLQVFSALQAKALAAQYELQITQSHGMGKVCLETDAMLVKNAVEDGKTERINVFTITPSIP